MPFQDARETNRELISLQSMLELQLDHMIRLHELSADLAENFDLQPVLEEVLRVIAEILGSDRGILYLYDRFTNDLYPMARTGVTEEESYMFGRIPIAQRPSGKAIASKKPVFISDVQAETPASYRSVARAIGFHSMYSIPLVARNEEVLGVVAILFRENQKPDRRYTQLLQLYAKQAAQAIENARQYVRLREEQRSLAQANADLENRFRKEEERRRALIHIMGDMKGLNKRLADQRKAMLHILMDYENDRSRLSRQTERLDNSRRALLHIMQDQHQSNLRLESSRKAMIHIMDDLRQTTGEVQRREQELRDKQEQLVQAGKLATLGELTTGVAHELNNPLNNIGLFLGNVIDLIQLGVMDKGRILQELHKAEQQVRKATEIISHLRIFGRAATATREAVSIGKLLESAASLVHEQLRLRQIDLEISCPEDVYVVGNPIQLEQVAINLLSNSRDALMNSPVKKISIHCEVDNGFVTLCFEDTGPGIPKGFEQRIFDPFFTTKEVGAGTGLGLSITYGIIKEHEGDIWVDNKPGEGATFYIRLPLDREVPEGPVILP